MGISQASYYRWKQERKVIDLLEKYCTKEDLEEFLEKGRISKFERTIENDEELDDFVLKSALFKIEIYGTRENTPFFLAVKQAFNKELIPACLPVKTFLSILTAKAVTDIASFEITLNAKDVKYENWKKIIKEFVFYKLSKKELKALINNKKYVKDYLSSLPHLDHG